MTFDKILNVTHRALMMIGVFFMIASVLVVSTRAVVADTEHVTGICVKGHGLCEKSTCSGSCTDHPVNSKCPCS